MLTDDGARWAAKSRHDESAALRRLYGTVAGRALLKLLCRPGLSRLCGRLLDAGISKYLVGPFVRRHGIDLEDYERQTFRSFNDFFTRRIRAERRIVDMTPEALIAPCDGLLSAYRISEDTVIPIKQSAYTLSSLLGGDPLAERYRNGLCLVFRLCVDHYHRYCFIDGGQAASPVSIQGKLHTVRPVALERYPIFTENCREYAPIHTDHFGQVVQIEVGAMLVGKIHNHPKTGRVERGEEKGMFLYGGSTVIVLLEPGRAKLSEGVFQAAREGRELPVELGRRIGSAF